jgi:hypothetical protein
VFKRLQQAVTLSLLIFFMVENMLPAFIDAHADKFSTFYRVSTPTEHCNVFSWILEENETEERDDHRTYSDQIICFVTSFTLRGFEPVRNLPPESILSGSQKLLKLIHLLRI